MIPFPLSMRRVLGAVIALPRPTTRAVAAAAGVTEATAYYRLLQLRDLGLVAWADGCDGTLRALVTIEAVAA